jgi:4-diphosphocytidyl-2-C-methyl-D-erythritol kinase
MRKDHDLPNITIHLHKNIPIGAGLGGGSADAAFFIKLINDKFEIQLSDEKMENYCRKLGADCAFFIQNKPVFAFDKGDVFEPIELALSNYHLALVMPPIHVSTAEAYRGVIWQQPKRSLKELIKMPIEEWQGNINNDFENHILESHPQIRKVKQALLTAGAVFSLMSGSGSSVYGVFREKVDLSFLEKDNLVFTDI